MSKSAEVELTQLKAALSYMAGLLDEGSLVERYDKVTREEIALVLEQLVLKVEGLPENVPDNLVQAAAVRAIIGASEKFSELERSEFSEELERRMRDADVEAAVQGHELGEWELVSEEEMEYQATCKNCGGFVYVSPGNTFNLLLESCARV